MFRPTKVGPTELALEITLSVPYGELTTNLPVASTPSLFINPAWKRCSITHTDSKALIEPLSSPALVPPDIQSAGKPVISGVALETSMSPGKDLYCSLNWTDAFDRSSIIASVLTI